MYLPNARDQITRDHWNYDASSTITTGGTAQLVLPVAISRASFEFINLSSTNMYIGFGGATATATITNGAVSSIAINNGGFNYTIPPKVRFIGGGNTSWNMQNSTFLGCGQINYPSPGNHARGHAVLTAGAVSSIVIDTPGSLYAIAPMIFLENHENDPFGAFLPSATAPGSIIIGATGGNYYRNHTNCFMDAVSVVCATSAAPFTCKYMP